MEILDYSEFIEDTRSLETELGSGIETTATVLDLPPADKEYFYSKRGLCQFCGRTSPIVHHAKDCGDSQYNDREVEISVWQCESCGWWELQYEDMWVFDSHHDTKYFGLLQHSILQKYDTVSIDVPIQALAKELKRRPHIIYDIHHRKMEELVGFVFSDFFNCEVQYCGKSHDGGIDLVLVMADKPVLVQVKRRMKPTDVEPVSSVREFLGAALLAGHTDCIFVTSADHFSSVGQAAARKALTRGLVTRYDLIDRRRFLDILDLVRTTKTEVWKEQVQLVLNKHA